MSKVESYSEVLDFSKEKMSEGDYIKLADFLKKLHSETEESEILRVGELAVGITLEFETYKGKQYKIKLLNSKRTIFRGPKPSTIELSGLVNDVPFTEEIGAFRTKWSNIIGFSGIKNIKRSVYDLEIEEFKHLRDFKNFLQSREDDDRREDCDDDDEHDVDGWTDEFITGNLFGILYIASNYF